jgi:hypothetical protein
MKSSELNDKLSQLEIFITDTKEESIIWYERDKDMYLYLWQEIRKAERELASLYNQIGK